jgi:hypothetical protein
MLGFIVWPPVTMAVAPRERMTSATPSPAATAHHRDTGRAATGSVTGSPRQRLRLQVHVVDLDLAELTPADGVASERAGVLGVDVDLDQPLVADDDGRLAHAPISARPGRRGWRRRRS